MAGETMRSRDDIEEAAEKCRHSPWDEESAKLLRLQVEVLLDIRDLLSARKKSDENELDDLDTW